MTLLETYVSGQGNKYVNTIAYL